MARTASAATTTYTDTIHAISDVIAEDLSGTVPDTQPDLDQFYLRLVTQSMGVESNGIGRGFRVVHPLREGLAGTIKWVSAPLGPAPLNVVTPITRTATHVSAYPGLAENVAPGHLTKIIDLARAKGNIFLPVEYAQADALDATMISTIAEIVRTAAQNIMLSEIHQFYRITVTDAQGIARIGVGSTPAFANANATTDQITFVVGEGSIRNFYTGMLLDFHAPSGATRRNTGAVVVNNVRYLPSTSADTGGWGQVVAVSTTGQNLTAGGAAIVAGDVIARVDSEGNGPLGPDDWLIATGAPIFGIDVDVFQQFQSIVSAVSGVATGTVLNKFMARFSKAYGIGNMPDQIVTSHGVTNAVIANDEGLGRFQLNDQRVFTEGFKMGVVPYAYGGRSFSWNVSDFMPSASSMTAATQTGGILWALKTKDKNIRRYVPPKPGVFDAGGNPLPNDIQFAFASKSGPFGIFKPRHDSNGDTVNFFEAPFDKWLAIAPVFIPGIKLTSLTEDT